MKVGAWHRLPVDAQRVHADTTATGSISGRFPEILPVADDRFVYLNREMATFLFGVLPAHHLGDPDRCERRCAVRRGRVVLEHLKALTYVDRTGTELGVLDPDL